MRLFRALNASTTEIGILVAKLGDSNGNLWLGLSVGIPVLANAAVSPFLGAVSDRYGRRLPFLFAFTVGAVVPSMLIPFVPVPIGVAST